MATFNRGDIRDSLLRISVSAAGSCLEGERNLLVIWGSIKVGLVGFKILPMVKSGASIEPLTAHIIWLQKGYLQESTNFYRGLQVIHLHSTSPHGYHI